MNACESTLLCHVLCYENGHPRRTQHILKVTALADLLGAREGLPEPARAVLRAAAMLHDIAIRHCKEHGDGDAGQKRQQAVAPQLVERFLREAGYPPEILPEVLEPVLHHHDYGRPRDAVLQLLMEADLIVNCYECPPDREAAEVIRAHFRSETGLRLLDCCLQGS